jgi:hypothetical protein
MSEDTMTTAPAVDAATSTVTTAGAADITTTGAPSIFSDGYRFAAGWSDSVGEPTLSKFDGKEVNDLAKAYANLEKLASRKSEGMVRIPTETSTPEEIAAYRTAVGAPEDPTGYTATFPEGMESHAEALSPFQEIFHKHSGSPALYQEAVAKWAQIEAEQLQAVQSAERQLVNEWGDDFEYRIGDIEARTKDVLDLFAADFRPDSTGMDRPSAATSSLEDQISQILASPSYRSGQDKGARDRLHALYREQAAREAATRR